MHGKRQVMARKATSIRPEVKAENGLYPIMFSVDKGNLKDGY
jgi:hypothetical protein